MFPLGLPRIFPHVHCDSDEIVSATSPAKAVRALQSVKNVMSVPETELKRWRRVFDSHATTVLDGHKCVVPILSYCFCSHPPTIHVQPAMFAGI